MSAAMPNAEIQNSFVETGCEFYGMTYATQGSSTTQVEDMGSLREQWIKQNYTEEQQRRLNEEVDEEFEEKVDETWYESAYDKCSEASDAILADLKADFKSTTHELKGRALVDVVRKVDENILINTWETTDVVRAMILAGYVSKELLDQPDGLKKEQRLETALAKFESAVTGTYEYIDAHIKSCRPTIT
jgi:hypothetical protein